jgi:beta-xylosidase
MVGVPVAQAKPPAAASSVPKPIHISDEPSRIFANPILTGFNPEPSITRVGEDIFMTTASFGYFPGQPNYHSNDLVNWELVVHALTRRTQLNLGNVEPGAGIRTPTFRYVNGVFYLAACIWDQSPPQTDVG